MNAVEVAIQRKNTRAFVAGNPVELVLTPNEKVRTGSGGFALVPQDPRTSQVVRVIDSATARSGGGIVRTEDGVERRYDYQLLGDIGTVVEVNDTFESGGKTWKVDLILPDNGYEVRAAVVAHG